MSDKKEIEVKIPLKTSLDAFRNDIHKLLVLHHLNLSEWEFKIENYFTISG